MRRPLILPCIVLLALLVVTCDQQPLDPDSLRFARGGMPGPPGGEPPGGGDGPGGGKGGPNLTSVSAGAFHSCGVTKKGDGYCWGVNTSSQLGDGTTTDRHAPVLVDGNHKFEVISAGNRHSCGVIADGSAYCWGPNDAGQLGDGSSSSTKSTPVLVSGGLVSEACTPVANIVVGSQPAATPTAGGRTVRGN